MSAATHYRMKSAFEIEGVVRLAGSIITAAEFATLSDEGRELLLTDAHVVECTPAIAQPPVFPRKRESKPKATE